MSSFRFRDGAIFREVDDFGVSSDLLVESVLPVMRELDSIEMHGISENIKKMNWNWAY